MESSGDKRVADYFVVAGLPADNLDPMDELNSDLTLKSTHRLDPITDIAVINRSLGETVPPGYKCVEFTPTGFPANLNHGSLRAPEMYVCYRRGRDKPPLVDIGVLYEVKDRLLAGCEVIYHTLQGRPANVNNTNSSRIYITYRRAQPLASTDTLSVVDICVILLNKSETPPHAYRMINKTLNKGMMGSDVYLCYKKSMTKTYALAYQPAVLSRYPLEDIPSLPLPDRVAMFCLPLGAAVEGWLPGTQHPTPVFSTFILTAATGEKMYGAGITFYEELDVQRLNEAQLEQLGAVTAEAEKGDEGTSGESGPVRKVYQNKCICLLSRSPYFDTFKRFLAYLRRLVLTGPHTLPLERHIVHFLSNIPVPSPQRPKILIQLDTTEVTLSHPDETPLPISGASYIEMLKNLGATNCVLLLLCTLMEQKLLIHSLRPAVLTSVAEAVANIIFPFHWQCPYIPLCPLGLSYVLNSPTPFIIGIDSRYFDLYDPPADVTCVDLDTNSISGSLFCCSEERKAQSLKMLPKKAAKVLKTTLEQLFDEIWRNTTVYMGVSCLVDETSDQQDTSRSRKEMQMEIAIQEAFLRFMAVVLKGYNNFLLPITKAPTLVTTDVSNLFDIQGFLKSRDKSYHKFYTQMMRTQAFSRFVEERSFVSDKDTGLTFFDECLDKVDENRDEPRLIEPEDSQKSDVTVFIMLPEPVGLPPGALYSYNGFPELNPDLYPHIDQTGSAPHHAMLKPLLSLNSSCPYSPMTRRTKHEIKSAQKLAMKHNNQPVLWAKCLVWHCYSLWFIHLPAYIKTVHSKAKALRTAYDVLVKMQSAKLQPPDEVCYRVLMQLCGLYHQPVLAVKVLFAMKNNDVQPNAITYGFYNKAVLESKWPSSSTTAYQRWVKLRHTILAVAQFKRVRHSGVLRRRPSAYSNSESDAEVQSTDGYLEGSSGPAGLAPLGWATNIMRDVAALARGEKPKSGTGPEEDEGKIVEESHDTVDGMHNDTPGGVKFSARQALSFSSQESLDSPDKHQHKLNHDESSHTITAHLQDEPEATQVVEFHVDDGTEIEKPSEETVNGNNSIQEDNTTSESNQISTEKNLKSIDASEKLDLTSDSDPDHLVTVSLDLTSDSDPDHLVTVSPLNCMEESEPQVTSSCDSVTETSAVTSLSSGSRFSGGSDAEAHLSIARANSSQSLTSPVHSVRTEVTQNDPLGLFSAEQSAGNHSAKGNVKLSESSPGLGSSGEMDFTPGSPPASNDEIISSKPPISGQTKLPRGDSIGSAMRSAASRFASKYREVKQTISSSGVMQKNGSLSSGSVNSLTSEQGSLSSIMDERRESRDRPDDVRISSAVEGAPLNEQKPEETVPEVNTDKSDVGTPGDKRKNSKGSGLYSPFVSGIWGGLKSIKRNEHLKAMASSIQTVTASVRDALIDSLSDDWLLNQMGEGGEMTIRDPETEYVWGRVEAGEDEPPSPTLPPPSDHDSLDYSAAGSVAPPSMTQQTSQMGLDHLVPVDEGSERGSLSDGAEKMRSMLEQLPSNLLSGSMSSLQPAVQLPMDVEICSMSKCSDCHNLLYDEEIMSGWTADESNLNTNCAFCCAKLVPLLQIYIKDYRHCVKPVLTNMSQSMESMASIQSTPSVQLGESGNFRRVTANPNPLSTVIPEDGIPTATFSTHLQTSSIIEYMNTDSTSLSKSCEHVELRTNNSVSITSDMEKTVSDTADASKQEELVTDSHVVTDSPVVYTSQISSETLTLSSEISALSDSTQLSSSQTENGESCETSVDSEAICDNDVIAESSTPVDSTTVPNSLVSTADEPSSKSVTESNENFTVQMRSSAPHGKDSGYSSADISKRWSSGLVEAAALKQMGVPSKEVTFSSKSVNKADSGTGSLESRRSLSECSLNAMSELIPSQNRVKSLRRGPHSSSVGNKLDDESSVLSTESGGSGKGTSGATKEPIVLDPINVPYLSPLVLRKEMENVLDLDGESCLSRPEFVDEHPILYWNLVWYFKRINVPSHILGFLMTASSINGNVVPSSVWGSADSRHVQVRAMWDNTRMHNENGEPMYISWNLVQRQKKKESAVFINRSSLESLKPSWSESTMHGIVTSIMNNNVERPLQLIMTERNRRKSATHDNAQPAFFSIYRDVLFLSLVALGRENIDIDAFDREFRTMITDLPPVQTMRMRIVDKYPNTLTCWCRRLFGELDL